MKKLILTVLVFGIFILSFLSCVALGLPTFRATAEATKQANMERTIAEGGTLDIRSRCTTTQEKVVTYERTVSIGTGYSGGIEQEKYDIFDAQGRKIGEVKGESRVVMQGAPEQRETVTETRVDNVHTELFFNLYKGDEWLLSGRTPANITGIEVDTEYTIRWKSPNLGDRWRKISIGFSYDGKVRGTTYLD